MTDATKLYDRFARKLELNFIPKRHNAFHLCHQVGWFGAIAATGTWNDERLNGRLRPIVQHASQLTWHARCLSEARRGLREED